MREEREGELGSLWLAGQLHRQLVIDLIPDSRQLDHAILPSSVIWTFRFASATTQPPADLFGPLTMSCVEHVNKLISWPPAH